MPQPWTDQWSEGVPPWCRSGAGSCDFNRERNLQTSVPLGTRRVYHPVWNRAHDEPGEEWGSVDREVSSQTHA
jgi:hypothetical protein